MKTVKTIDIHGKRWFDSRFGNTYNSARVTVNFTCGDEQTFKIPFGYGYDQQYEQRALELLSEELGTPQRLHELRRAGIKVTSTVEDTTKRNAESWGK